MMNYKNKFPAILLLIALTLFFSCKKFVEIPLPKNQITTGATFSDSTNAVAAVSGIYINMMQSNGFMGGGLTLYTGLSSDELNSLTGNPEEMEFENNEILTTNSINASVLWTNAYNLIYNANACYEGLQRSTTLPEGLRRRLMGEAKFSRAFLYFNLLNLYGKVPLVITTDYKENSMLKNTSVDSIYAQIIDDLIDAKDLLPADYTTPNRLRPNKYTAMALLAKVYLYKKDWIKSEGAATEVISAGEYNLDSDLGNVFAQTSNEAIWKLSPVLPGFETWDGYSFIPFSSADVPFYKITSYLLNAFEPDDQRKSQWLNYNVVGNDTFYYPYKYKLTYDGLAAPSEYYVVFRLAEQYLIRAEAKAMQNQLAEALADIQLIRERAGLPDLPSTLDQPEILSAIEQERRIELLCEWGNRWFDLKRSNTADSELSIIKPNWQSTDVLYPIPRSEIQLNPFLKQNQGY